MTRSGQTRVRCAVAPRIRTRRVACSITARTYIRVPVSVTIYLRTCGVGVTDKHSTTRAQCVPYADIPPPGLYSQVQQVCIPQANQILLRGTISRAWYGCFVWWGCRRSLPRPTYYPYRCPGYLCPGSCPPQTGYRNSPSPGRNLLWPVRIWPWSTRLRRVPQQRTPVSWTNAYAFSSYLHPNSPMSVTAAWGGDGWGPAVNKTPPAACG
jgi:hypothetical protein